MRADSMLFGISLAELWRLTAAATIAMLAASAAHAACTFAPVKQQIDIVLDKDAALGGKFRKEVAEGSDSIAVLETLVSARMREQIDICRFYVAEYLAKRGFPPAH
jgi:hypothetical protein